DSPRERDVFLIELACREHRVGADIFDGDGRHRARGESLEAPRRALRGVGEATCPKRRARRLAEVSLGVEDRLALPTIDERLETELPDHRSPRAIVGRARGAFGLVGDAGVSPEEDER